MPRKLTKATKRRSPKRGPRRRSAASPAFSSGLQAGLIRDIQGYHRALTAQRAEIDAQITAIEQALGAFGAATARSAAAPHRAAAPSSRPNGPRPGSLKDFIGRVLSSSGSPMMVKDIASAVVKAGYKTKNKTLATSVGLALADMRNVKKVSRGKYRLK